MTGPLDGIYAVYLSGKAGQGFAMLIFRKGKIVGAGPLGDVYDGSYRDASDNMLSVNITTEVTAKHYSQYKAEQRGQLAKPENWLSQLHRTFPRKTSFVSKHNEAPSM